MVKVYEIKQSVFADNDHQAELLRDELKAKGIFLLNLMSSPGDMCIRDSNEVAQSSQVYTD